MNPFPRRDDPKIGWKQGARLVARTIGLVARASRRGTAALALLTLGVSVLPLAMAWVGKLIVDAVVLGSRDLALRWVAVELGLVASQALAQRTLGLIRELLGERLSRDVNVAILEKAVTLEIANFEDGRFYDRLTRARQGASHRPLSVVTEGFQLGQNLLTLLGYLALIVSWSPWAALALLAAAVPAALVEMRFSRSVFRLNNWRSPESRQLNYLEYVLSNVHHVKEVKLFGLGPVFLGRYRGLYDKFFDEDSRLAVKRAGAAFALALVATAVFYGCYASVALAAARGAITLGSMTLYLVAFRQGQQAFQSVLAAISGMYEDVLYMSNLFEYLAFEARTSAAPDTTTASEQGIRFEDVGFRYPAAPAPANGSKANPGGAPANGKEAEEKWALRHVSFFVPRGQSVALVGENGAGKTTIVKLLTRLYEPTEGRVLLDGKDLRAIPGAARRDLPGLQRVPARPQGEHWPWERPPPRRQGAHRARLALGRRRRRDRDARRGPRDPSRQVGARRRRALRGPVAEDRARARLHARGGGYPRPRRAHGVTRCARRARGLPALPRPHEGADDLPHLAPLLHGAHG